MFKISGMTQGYGCLLQWNDSPYGMFKGEEKNQER